MTEGGQGEIVIIENDDARGVIELSASSVRVSEPNVGSFLQILRKGGTFGSVSKELLIRIRHRHCRDARVEDRQTDRHMDTLCRTLTDYVGEQR